MTEPQQEPRPTCVRCTRPRTASLLCTRCADNLKRWLTDIPDLYATAMALNIRDRPAGEHSESRHTKVSGSPALVNVTLMAIQDPASNAGDGIIPVVPALTSWAHLFVEEQEISSGRLDYLYEIMQLFSTWWTTLLRQPWIDEFYSEVSDIHRMLSGATNAPKSIGRCFGWVRNAPPCGQRLYPAVDGTEVVCDKCGRRYSGLDLVRLELSQERGA